MNQNFVFDRSLRCTTEKCVTMIRCEWFSQVVICVLPSIKWSVSYIYNLAENENLIKFAKITTESYLKSKWSFSENGSLSQYVILSFGIRMCCDKNINGIVEPTTDTLLLSYILFYEQIISFIVKVSSSSKSIVSFNKMSARFFSMFFLTIGVISKVL